MKRNGILHLAVAVEANHGPDESMLLVETTSTSALQRYTRLDLLAR